MMGLVLGLAVVQGLVLRLALVVLMIWLEIVEEMMIEMR